MKEQIIKRGLFGLPVGIAIGFLIPLLISAAVGDGNYYPVTPQLIETMGNELHAVMVRRFCADLWEQDLRWLRLSGNLTRGVSQSKAVCIFSSHVF